MTVAPQIIASKRDALLIDVDNSGAPSHGDTVVYNITIINTGNVSATDVIFQDKPDPLTTLVAGTVQTNQGTVTTGNTNGD